VNIAIVILVALLPQETHELKWALKEGQAFTCAWTADTRASSPEAPGFLMDLKFEIKATLSVIKVGEKEARCQLVLSTYSLKGSLQGNEVDILFENGAVRRPDPEGDRGKSIFRECTKPVSLQLTPRGIYSIEGKHLVQGLFEGQSDFFGSQLPPAPVAVGGTWEGQMESPQSRAQGRTPLKVRYKLESLKEDAARIVLDERQDIKAAGRVMEFHAVSESIFNTKAGHCARAKATVEVSDMTDPAREAPEKPDISMTLTFEMAEKK